jgi:hypothetical protein
VLLGLTALFVPLILGLAFAQGLSSLDEVLAQRDRSDASSRVDLSTPATTVLVAYPGATTLASAPLPSPELLREAADPSTPAARLAELGEHPIQIIQRAVASNPSAPEATLRRLLPRYPIAVLDNAAWPLLALTDPSLAEKGEQLLATVTRSEATMHRLAENPALHPHLITNPALTGPILERLASSAGYLVRRGVAFHARCPEETLLRLARRGSDEAMTRLLDRPIGTTLLPGLEHHPSEVIRGKVVQHPDTSPPALIVLAQDRSYRIRGLVASHPSAPGEALAEVFRRDHDERTRHLLASHPATPAEMLLAIARRDAQWQAALWCRLASHPAAPPELLGLLAQHGSRKVKDALAAREAGRSTKPPRLPGHTPVRARRKGR